ncbi:MAG: hypothetical protein JJ992_07420, partial [Planctomycetes bacterium]|nr:hypothetical protein [Planctomycetota bacterium]
AYDFQLVVIDQSGNASTPAIARVSVLELDAVPPTSRVDALPAEAMRLSFAVSATAYDPDSAPGVPGSGVKSIDIYVSQDQGAFQWWTSVTPGNPTATFEAEGGHRYDFYSVAHDVAGNVESDPPTADATIWVPDFGLACGPPLKGSAANVFLQCSGVVGALPESLEFDISAPEFELAGGVTRLGFHVTSSAGWDPVTVVIQDAGGKPVSLLHAAADLAGHEASLALAQLGYGTYTISVQGDGSVPGDVTLSVFLAGDGDGNGVVELADLIAMRGLLGAHAGDGRYRVEWDSDLDGDLDTADYLQCRYNLNDSVDLFLPLMLAGDAASDDPFANEVSEAQIQRLLQTAVTQFAAAGIDASQLAMLNQVEVNVADLRGSTLGLARGNAIWLDRNAAGYGWQIGPGSGDGGFSNFDSDGVGKVDLLTVVSHELGHVLGWQDLSPDAHSQQLMTGILLPGEQRFPEPLLAHAATDSLRVRALLPPLSSLDAFFAE